MPNGDHDLSSGKIVFREGLFEGHNPGGNGGMPPVGASRSTEEYLTWIAAVVKGGWNLGVYAVCGGVLLNLVFARYVYPVWSAVMRKIRVRQYYDVQSDIRKESSRFKAKEFLPQKYYKKGMTFIGLDEHNRPIHVPLETWHETHRQIIGPETAGVFEGWVTVLNVHETPSFPGVVDTVGLRPGIHGKNRFLGTTLTGGQPWEHDTDQS